MTNLKSWYGVLFLVLLAGVIVWATLNGMPLINSLRAKWEAQRLQAQWEKPYREDTYGGKTPEETYDMFLAALSKGDIVLASKYFVVKDQNGWKKTLEQYKSQNIIASFINELENTKKTWKKSSKSTENTVSFKYAVAVKEDTVANLDGQKINIPAGSYVEEAIFDLNTYTKVWKISSL